MKNKRKSKLLFILFLSLFFSSCSFEKPTNIDYSFKVAKDVKQDINQFNKVNFESDFNLDLGFYSGEVWIKLQAKNGAQATSFMVLCNDLINHNYRFYKLDTLTNTFLPCKEKIDLAKYDHRSFSFSKPNFLIDLKAFERSTFLITTSSDGRILQATPKLISVNDFESIKKRMLIFDIVFYFSIVLLLLINLFYFRLVRSDIYYYYGFYILSGCLMYLFVEGRLYGLGLSNVAVDHLMFISIRLWILSSVLFSLKFLDTKRTNPKNYRFILIMLLLTLGLTTFYQFLFPSFSISTLHTLENMIGFVWIILSLTTVGIAYKKRKVLSNYYLVSYSVFLLFVTLGLLDSHTTMLPGDPFSYFKIGTILEFIGFTYFITLLIKQKLKNTEELEKDLNEREKLIVSKNTNLASIFKIIETSFANDSDWVDFKERFKTINPSFIHALLTQHSDLTKAEIRLLTLIRIGYSQKEIAQILNIVPDSVKKARSRVRKKLDLAEENELSVYLQNF